MLIDEFKNQSNIYKPRYALPYESILALLCYSFKSICIFLIFLDLHAGLIEEYDSTMRLLENKSSSFAQLVAEYSSRSGSNF